MNPLLVRQVGAADTQGCVSIHKRTVLAIQLQFPERKSFTVDIIAQCSSKMYFTCFAKILRMETPGKVDSSL